jgi:hypothetical protein
LKITPVRKTTAKFAVKRKWIAMPELLYNAIKAAAKKNNRKIIQELEERFK